MTPLEQPVPATPSDAGRHVDAERQDNTGRKGDTAQPSTPKLGRKRDHSRDPEILEAALDVLAETGYDGLTVDMVATRAKAGKATLYRRWASKDELVIDAVACMKQVDLQPSSLPDTGTLRGDLVGMIRTTTIDQAERKLKIMTGIVSMLSRSPEMTDAAHAALVEPRASATRFLLQRAIDRGEISGDIDIATIALISPSMAAYRTLILRTPVTREFLISTIDNVVLPAVGLRNPVPAA